MTDFRVGTGFDAHAFEDGVPLVLGGVRIDHPRGMAGHSDGDVLAHALTDAVLGAAGMEDIGALFPSGDPALEGADSIGLLREAWRRVREDGWELVERRRRPDRRGAAARAAPQRDARAARRRARGRAGAGRGARDDDRRPRVHRPPGRTCRAGRRITAAMKLRITTQAEQDLRESMPQLWPEFMNQDPIVSTFWPRLYELYPDFQFWVVDGKETVAYACTVPVRWDGIPEPRGIDWALSNGVAGDPSDLCAIVVGIAARVPRPGPERGAAPADGRSRGGARARLHDRPGAADVEGALSADPDRAVHALAPRGRAAATTRGCGRTSALGAEILDPAPRSMTVTGSRDEWEEWTGLQFPEDGDYVVPGALVPVRFEGGTGTYVEPNVWMRHSI